jgi:LysR family transcriptional regulator (chromosome initiation inhibitor)
MQVLESEAMAEFGALGAGPALARTVAIAVNDDSLQTWVMAALSDLHSSHGFLFDVRVDDQDYTIEYLRTGVVLGAVTSQSTPLQGCNVYALGSMRYHAIASPDFKLRHFSEGLNATSLGSAPLIVFNRKDELQWRFMRRITRARLEPPVHYLPTSTGFVEAAARGLGWCLAPDSLVAPALKAGSVAILDRARWLDVALYWQQAAVRSASLAALGLALRQAAATVLHR